MLTASDRPVSMYVPRIPSPLSEHYLLRPADSAASRRESENHPVGDLQTLSGPVTVLLMLLFFGGSLYMSIRISRKKENADGCVPRYGGVGRPELRYQLRG